MIVRTIAMLVAVLVMADATAAILPEVAALRQMRRVLVVSAPDAQDPGFRRQMQLVSGWTEGREARDVTVVRIVGDRVTGAGDSAAALRTRLGLSPRGFMVALIGKDGQVALRASTPLAASATERRIDAMPMPMRRAGQR